MGKQSKHAAPATTPGHDEATEIEVREAWDAETTISGRLSVYSAMMDQLMVDVDDDEWEQLFGRGVVDIFQQASHEFARAEAQFGRPIDFARDSAVICANVSPTALAVWKLAVESMTAGEEEPLDAASEAAEMRAAAGGEDE